MHVFRFLISVAYFLEYVKFLKWACQCMQYNTRRFSHTAHPHIDCASSVRSSTGNLRCVSQVSSTCTEGTTTACHTAAVTTYVPRLVPQQLHSRCLRAFLTLDLIQCPTMLQFSRGSHVGHRCLSYHTMCRINTVLKWVHVFLYFKEPFSIFEAQVSFT